MRNALVLTAVLAIAGVNAQADEFTPSKKAATFLGSSAAGAALGGPLGMLAGAIAGVWFGEQIEQAAELEETEIALQHVDAELLVANRDVHSLRGELEEMRDSNLQYAQLVMQQLELEMLFKTGETQLTAAGRQRLAQLANFLLSNPQVGVRLDGYADPRGASDYNQQLSASRVNYVATTLEDLGVAVDRVEAHSHGASQSDAGQNDYDAYALERVVKIQLHRTSQEGFAQAD